MSITDHINRRNAIRGLIGAAGAAGGAFGWGFLVEPNFVSVNHFETVLPFLPKSLDGLKVGHLTDFHYRPDKDSSLIAKAVAKTNELDLDLIVLTGDFVDSDISSFAPLVDHIGKLKAKHGIYAVLGNHDGWAAPGVAPRVIREGLEKHDISLLMNQNSTIEINNTALAIAGTNYVWLGAPNPKRTLRGIDPSTPTLALVHEPDYFDTLRKYRANIMQFSGHTHGGQCRIPFTGYAPVKVTHGRNYNYGNYSKGNSRLFVSRGIGTTGPRVRFACSPEIAVVTLRSSET